MILSWSSIDNYKILRCDGNRQEGGVVCYVKNGLQSDSYLPKKIFLLLLLFVCFNGSPLKRMKNTFYFSLKTLGHVEKTAWLKNKVIFKTYDVSAWLTNSYSTILPNISQSKDNQIIKLGQLIECSKRYISLQKSCRKWGRELIPDHFLLFFKSLILGQSKCFAA